MKLRRHILAALSGALFLAVTAGGKAEEDGGEQRYYNAKLGPIYITFNSSLETEYNDNINLSSGRTDPIISDLIITPRIGMTAATQVAVNPEEKTNRTILSLGINLGYKKYVQHPELDQNLTDINIDPNTQVSFLIHADPLKIRLYDSLSLESDPVADGSLNNVVSFRRLANTIGARTQWDINKLTTASLDLSHRNFYVLGITGLNTSGQTTNLSTSEYNSYSDNAGASISTRPLSFLDLGLNGSITTNTFPSASEKDSITTSYGPTATLRFSDYTFLTASTGVSHWQSTHTQSGNATDNTSHYYNLTLTNNFNRYYTHSISAGRQTSLDLLGALNQSDYVRYTATWKMNSLITLTGGVSFDDIGSAGGTQTSWNPRYASTGDYRLLHADLGTQFALSRKLTTSLAFRHIQKMSGNADYDYTQNQFLWDLTYNF